VDISFLETLQLDAARIVGPLANDLRRFAGVATGEIPLVAIRYQMVVVFMQGAATALGSLLFVRLAAGRYLTPAHQLRRYLL